jgi:hypothetical protein
MAQRTEENLAKRVRTVVSVDEWAVALALALALLVWAGAIKHVPW